MLESKRLDKSRKSQVPIQFAEFNATRSTRSGFLNVSTSPQGASITIDKKSYGFSPSRIRLEPGQYSILIDHPYFRNAKEEIIVRDGEVSKISKILLRSKRRLYIQTKPEGASVELSGKYLGISPVETSIPTGDKQTLLIRHPETEDYQSSIKVGKGDEIYLLKVPLILKPSYLTIESTPEGADVYLNEKFMDKTPTKLLEGKHGDKIKVVKDGYISHIDTLKIKGGENRQLNLDLIKQDRLKSNLNNPDLIRIAVESGNINIISMMVENGANLNEKYEDGETLLGLVIREPNEDNNKDMIITLVKNGANINTLDQNGKPLFHKVIDTYGCNKELFSLFDSGAVVNMKSLSKNKEAGRNPAYSNYFEVATSGLLHAIARKYSQPSSFNERDNCLDIASLLSEKGAKMDATDSYGKTPLQYIENRNDRKKWSNLLLKQKLAEPCHQGDVSSCVSLAAIEEKNGDAVQSHKLLTRACEGGLWNICLKLGLREKGWDEEQAQYFFSKACQGGIALACSEAGLIADNLGDINQSKSFFLKACNGGEMFSCYKLGIIERDLEDYIQAAKHLNQSCKGGETNACLAAQSVEVKQREIMERKIASKERIRLVRVFEQTTLNHFFSVSLGVIGGAWGQVNYKKVTINEHDKTGIASDKALTYGEAFNFSLGYTKFINKNYLNVGLDITTSSESDEDNIFTVQPISLFSNLGTIKRIGGRSCIKFFGGIGLSYVKLEAEGIESDGSMGYLLQLGTGLIQRTFHIDLIFRSIFSPKKFRYDLKMNDRSYRTREDFDLLIFQPMLRLGFSF